MAELIGLAVGAVGLGLLHGVLPDHGWPIAAMYALDTTRRWAYGFAAGLILGVGHLFSSLVLVGVYFAVETRYDLIGASWLGYIAGGVLILLGLRELRHAYHEHGHDHDHGFGESRYDSLLSIGWVALVLGFAHEEPIQIIAICAGTEYCLELMVVYSLAVIVAILVPTLLLVAGYERYTETVERYESHLPTLTGIVLVAVGSGFILGVF